MDGNRAVLTQLCVLLQGATMLAESAVGDLWMPLTVFVTLAVTLGIGLAKFAKYALVHV